MEDPENSDSSDDENDSVDYYGNKQGFYTKEFAERSKQVNVLYNKLQKIKTKLKDM